MHKVDFSLLKNTLNNSLAYSISIYFHDRAKWLLVADTRKERQTFFFKNNETYAAKKKKKKKTRQN